MPRRVMAFLLAGETMSPCKNVWGCYVCVHLYMCNYMCKCTFISFCVHKKITFYSKIQLGGTQLFTCYMSPAQRHLQLMGRITAKGFCKNQSLYVHSCVIVSPALGIIIC